MTAPRQTSELVTELELAAADHCEFLERMQARRTEEYKARGDLDANYRADVKPEDTIYGQAAASLQSLEARNKELEGALEVVRLSGGNSARTREDTRFGDVVISAAAWDAVIAALHPATKTGET